MFGSVHCEDFGLYLAHADRGSPEPKTTLVQIPGSSVELDFTEAFGDVQYAPRTMNLSFLTLDKWSDQVENETALKNALHGKKMHITFDDDPSHYYVGRISVGSWLPYKSGGKVSMKIHADPWKYCAPKQRSLPTASSSTQATVTLVNAGRKWIVPTITTTASTTLAFGNYSVTIGAGEEQVIPQLILKPGNNPITATYTGTVTYKWQEADL